MTIRTNTPEPARQPAIRLKRRSKEMRSPKKTATALESPHVPVSAAAATTRPTPTRALGKRVVGATAIALAA